MTATTSTHSTSAQSTIEPSVSTRAGTAERRTLGRVLAEVGQVSGPMPGDTSFRVHAAAVPEWIVWSKPDSSWA